jgi:DNA-binding transcriptional regulator YiaG
MKGIPRHGSSVLRSAHAAAKDLYAIAAIDSATMRRFDHACLIEAPQTNNSP